MTIATQVLILFGVVVVGMIARRLRFFTDETIRGVTQLVVYITLPCMTICNMQRPFDAQVLRNFLLTIAVTLASIALMAAAGLLIFKKRPRARRAVLANVQAFSNCGFMGYPIINAINPDWMIYAVAYNIAFTFGLWTLGAGLFRGLRDMSFKRALVNPNIISALIGFACFCLSLTIPAVPLQILSLIGGLTTPLSMLLIGTRILGVRLTDFRDLDYHVAAALRLVIFPLCVLGALRALGAPDAVTGTMFILTAMPSASMVTMQAELYGGDVQFAARATAYTTLLALASVPLMSLLL